jgi:hypothetical protein
MNMIDIRIAYHGSRRVAYYRQADSKGKWFSLTVKQAERALRDGTVSVGVSVGVPCRMFPPLAKAQS